jgi:hypothetical protein
MRTEVDPLHFLANTRATEETKVSTRSSTPVASARSSAAAQPGEGRRGRRLVLCGSYVAMTQNALDHRIVNAQAIATGGGSRRECSQW